MMRVVHQSGSWVDVALAKVAIVRARIDVIAAAKRWRVRPSEANRAELRRAVDALNHAELPPPPEPSA